MTLVAGQYRPLVLVLLHISGREEWPFSGTKLFVLITLSVGLDYFGYLADVQFFAEGMT
jgi:hypothetical protein